MNILFATVFILSAVILLFISPDTFLSALLDGSSKSATLCLSLLATYSVWLGLMQVWEDSGVSRAVSRLLKPVAKKLFKTDDEETLNALAMNASVNLLGISGAATPYGIRAAQLLDNAPNAEHSSAMLFVINATSIQVLPTSIIAIRTALRSVAPADIVLPTLFTSLFSTLLGVALVYLLVPIKKRTPLLTKIKGAGTQ